MKRFLPVMLIVGLLIALFPLAAAASPPSQEPPPPECNPRARMLADLLSEWLDEEVTCQYLMEKQAQGIGFGVMMKAFLLGKLFDLDWEDLVTRHMEEDLGWGQVMKAYYLASLLEDVTGEELLQEHLAGKGWGDILKERGLGPGRPPWAGQGKPPWAKGRGKPPWAGPHGSKD